MPVANFEAFKYVKGYKCNLKYLSFLNHFIGNKLYEGRMQTCLKKQNQKRSKGYIHSKNHTYLDELNTTCNITEPALSLFTFTFLFKLGRRIRE